MIPFLDLHTHKTKVMQGTFAIQSLAISEAIFLAMPKTKPISIGIHPWFSKADEFEKNIKYLNVLARQNNVMCIGECGLDRLKGENISFQTQVFDAQVILAEELGKPVIVHCVKAFDEIIAVKKRLKPTAPLIIHGFNKNQQLGHQLMQQGFYLSFGSAVLSRPSVAAFISTLDAPFFLETDDDEVSIEKIYQKVAEIRKITVEELKDIIFANWKKVGLQP